MLNRNAGMSEADSKSYIQFVKCGKLSSSETECCEQVEKCRNSLWRLGNNRSIGVLIDLCLYHIPCERTLMLDEISQLMIKLVDRSTSIAHESSRSSRNPKLVRPNQEQQSDIEFSKSASQMNSKSP